MAIDARILSLAAALLVSCAADAYQYTDRKLGVPGNIEGWCRVDEKYGTPAIPILAISKDHVDFAVQLLPGMDMTPPKFSYGDGLHLPSPPPGRMKAMCIVTLEGVPTNCCVAKGLPGYNRELLRVLRSWRYEPATFEGKPVSVIFEIEVDVKAGQAKKVSD